MSYRKSYHVCELPFTSDSCLPRLPPYSGWHQQCLRSFQKWFIVSEENRHTKQTLRSHAAIMTERRRHIYSDDWYIIHPFSRLCQYREIVMCIVWGVTTTLQFLQVAFLRNFLPGPKAGLALLVLEVICALDIVLNFYIGYFKAETKEIILCPRSIAKHYLTTFYIVDFLPLVDLYRQIDVIGVLLLFLKFFRLFRIKHIMDYFHHISIKLNASETLYKIMCLIILLYFCLITSTCLSFAVSNVLRTLYPAYVEQANTLSNKNRLLILVEPEEIRFEETFKSSVIKFYGSGFGYFYPIMKDDVIITCFIVLAGSIFFAYAVVVVLQMMSTMNASETKYEEILYQLKQYMRNKKLPEHLQRRMFMFYEYRFQKKYFRENAILATLSEHLRLEITLHCCRGLVERVAVFEGISKGVVGSIIACLKSEVFLPNDVIVKAGTPCDSMFFISSGTVTMVTPLGKEVCHMEDGDHFGEVGLVMSKVPNRIGSVIAIEICEAYRLDAKDFRRIISPRPEIVERIMRTAQERFTRIKYIDDQFTTRMRRASMAYGRTRGSDSISSGSSNSSHPIN